MLKILRNTLFIYLFYVNVSYCYEANQYLDGEYTDEPLEQKKDVEKVENSSFLPDQILGNEEREKKIKNDFNQSLIEDDTPEIDSSLGVYDKAISKDGHVQGLHENESEILRPDLKQDFKEVRENSMRNFSLMFLKDSFQYKRSNSSVVFNNIFRSSSSKFPLMVILSSQKFFLQSILGRLGLGLNAGIGYHAGKGKFVDGTFSDANFILWTLPLDVGIIYELPIFSLLKLGVSGGPSLLGMVQSRSDLEDGNKKKSIRQMGRGYYYEGYSMIRISNLFSDKPYSLLREYSVTNIYLTLKARFEQYNNFKSNELAVSGASYGVGFTYEVF